ncbi:MULTISPECIES: hypothetical protein [Brevundimonas]|uniref:hypothetical protein n=1 Tax=Brevundimonas sp. 357 TaxID=2555782 RepID=UPI000F7AF644|nr:MULTISPECIES: hypothetical protein [Brevundimonas]
MRGEVLTFDQTTGMGAILGDDTTRYLFNVTQVRTPLPLTRGQKVDFVPMPDSQAAEIFALQSSTPAAWTSQVVNRGGQFDLGRVIQRTFSTIRDNAAIFFGAAAIMVGIPSTLMGIGQTSFVTGYSPTGLLAMGAGWVFYLVGMFMLQGMVVKAAVNSFNGKATSFGQAFDVGVKMFLPLLGVAIIAALGAGLGYLALIVPGVIISVMWSVASSAVVVEKRGVLESLQRSRDLTRGYRWNVFGLMVIYVILSWIIGAAIGALGLATGGSFLDGSPNLWVNVVSGVLVNILSSVVASAGVAALYYELRTVKEGAGPEALAAVFD